MGAVFKPTILYVMEHAITRKKYFGKTIRINSPSYLGSGSYWSNHINKYGREHVNRIWKSEIFYDEQECKEFALAFSEFFDIVESEEWANQILESGTDGHSSGYVLSDDTKSKISKSLIGKPSPKSKYEIKEPIEIRSKRTSSQTKNKIWINNGTNELRIHEKDFEKYNGWKIGRFAKFSDNGMGERIRIYNLNPARCSCCNKPHSYQKRNRTYCSVSCSNKMR